ncbi:DNA-directed RNA polymerase subunit alpha [Caerostris extrusa]|uniref:DNA-directed RNA polymerase subunit alpha n=1 Tax=Caerostris extrusa TaxID=172846 RepID=A0AAV4MCM0_CAEEX|nr:DNA-directed RNA polymerase subunit alpha [Caerostris extrusa]
MKTDPSLGILQEVAQKTWEETNLEVGSFVTSILDSYANASLPCLQLLSHRIKLVISQIQRFDIGIQHSKDYLWTLFDVCNHYTGMSANDLLDHVLKFLGVREVDIIPKNTESSIFPKTNVVPRNQESWKMTMYNKMFYTVTYNYFDANDVKKTGDTEDFMQHYFRKDGNHNIMGHLVKLFAPSSYHTEAIARTLPYPVEFKRENLLLFSLRFNFKYYKNKASKSLKLLLEPSAYLSTQYTNEMLNLRDCKTVGVYHTNKVAFSDSVELEFAMNNNGKYNFTFRFPVLPKQTFSFHSEAGTYSGAYNSTTLPIMGHKVPIETLPARFKRKNKKFYLGLLSGFQSLNVGTQQDNHSTVSGPYPVTLRRDVKRIYGFPPISTETLSEDLLVGFEETPKDLRESVIRFIEKYQNAGWRRKSINVTRLTLFNEWSTKTTGTLTIAHARHYPKNTSKSTENLEDLIDSFKRPCFIKFMTKDNETYAKERNIIQDAFRGELPSLEDTFKIRYQQSEKGNTNLTVDTFLDFNRTLDGKVYHMVNISFLGLANDPVNIFKYNDKSYDKQIGGAGLDIEFGKEGTSVFTRESLNKTIGTEFETPVMPEVYLPVTHKECIEDVKKGNEYSLACIQAIRERSLLTTSWEISRGQIHVKIFDSYKLKATNNSYPVTCALTDKYVTTFDMVNYRLPLDIPKCTYILSAHCMKRKKFAVMAKFIARSPGTKEIHMYLGKDTVILTPQNKSEVYNIKYNNKQVAVSALKVVTLNLESQIFAYAHDWSGGILVVEGVKAGVKVTYNGKNVFVEVSPKYKGEACGLCGDFNGEPSKEFLGVDGCLYSDSSDFAKILHCQPLRRQHSQQSLHMRKSKNFADFADFGKESTEPEELLNLMTSDTRLRNIVLSREDKMCFSVEPQPVCEDDSEPKETEDIEIDFACYPKNNLSSKHMLVESSYRILTELEGLDPDFAETVPVARSC